jgi:hypothetical protein
VTGYILGLMIDDVAIDVSIDQWMHRCINGTIDQSIVTSSIINPQIVILE